MANLENRQIVKQLRTANSATTIANHLEEGEIGVRYSVENPELVIKDASGNTVNFIGSDAIDVKLDALKASILDIEVTFAGTTKTIKGWLQRIADVTEEE